MLIGNWIVVFFSLSINLVPFLLSVFSILGAKKRPHGSELSVAGTGHPGLYS